MVTADSVKSKIRGLIDKSNAKTGHIDKDLTAAVDTLIAGYGEDGTALPEIDPSILGTSNDLVSGKQLIDSSGNIIIGKIPETSSGITYHEPFASLTNTTPRYMRFYQPITENILFRPGSGIAFDMEPTKFGDASAADVAKGKTFTSQNGLKVVGIREDDGGVTLPTLTNPGTASDMASGKQLIDANGNVVQGTLMESKPNDGTLGFTGYLNPEIFINTPGGVPTLNISAQVSMEKIVRKDAKLCTRAPLTEFGDATAADVAAGKTFTSAAGHKVVGTMSPGGGFTVTDDGAGNVTITSSAITDNNGNVVIA